LRSVKAVSPAGVSSHTVRPPRRDAPFGFEKAGRHGLILPGPVAPERFQVLEIVPGALAGVTVPIGRAEDKNARPRRSLRSASAA